MRKIKKPTTKVEEVLDDAISNMQDSTLKQEITNSKPTFQRAELIFNTRKLSNRLFTIPQNQTVSTRINKKTLKGLYTHRMVKKNNLARKHYDSIFISAPNGKCPLCNQRIVKTLDHYLPKSKYPIYSITPLNLIPACSDCNKDKLVEIPTSRESETLHPYYDDVEGLNWLKSRIVTIKPIVFEYYVSPPTDWSTVLAARLDNHFASFGLNKLYSTHASEEFENIKLQLTNLYNSIGEASLKQHLEESFQSRYDVNKNSWQTAFYECLVNSASFLNGDFI